MQPRSRSNRIEVVSVAMVSTTVSVDSNRIEWWCSSSMVRFGRWVGPGARGSTAGQSGSRAARARQATTPNHDTRTARRLVPSDWARRVRAARRIARPQAATASPLTRPLPTPPRLAPRAPRVCLLDPAHVRRGAAGRDRRLHDRARRLDRRRARAQPEGGPAPAAHRSARPVRFRVSSAALACALVAVARRAARPSFLVAQTSRVARVAVDDARSTRRGRRPRPRWLDGSSGC